MASQGPTLAGSGTSVAYGTVAWSAPSAITADDGSLASVSLAAGESSHLLYGSSFGFSIGADATINGIVVEWNDPTNNGDLLDTYLTKDGVNTAGLAKGVTTVAGWAAYGSSSDLWTTTWTADQINASTFGAMLFAQDQLDGSSYSVDAVRVTVYYTPPVFQVPAEFPARHFGPF